MTTRFLRPIVLFLALFYLLSTPAVAAVGWERETLFQSFGIAPGGAVMLADDYDGDGRAELLLDASTQNYSSGSHLYVVDYDAHSNEYHILWTSPITRKAIRTAVTYRVGSRTHVAVGYSDGSIDVFDVNGFEHIGSVASTLNTVNDLAFGDADNDKANEIIALGPTGMALISPDNLGVEQTLPYGGDDIEVGQVDSDSAKEVVISNGLVLQLATSDVLVEWDYLSTGFGVRIRLADIDADGRDEIVGAESWYYLTTFDADLKSTKYQTNADLDIDALETTDIDGNGTIEIIYGDGQWGGIHVLEGSTGDPLMSISNPESGVGGLAIANLDNDPASEVAWSASLGSSAGDHLFVADSVSNTIEFDAGQLDPPFLALAYGDVDDDGKPEIVFASSESDSGSDDGIVYIMDAETGSIEWNSGTDFFGGYAWTGLHDIAFGDVDDDGQTEILVATDRLYDGALYVIDGATHTLENRYIYDDGAPLYSLAIGDVDADGDTEIVAGGGREHSGAPGVYVYIIDGATGDVEWHSAQLGAYWKAIVHLSLANVDSDPALEIIALNDTLYVFDGATHTQQQQSASGNYSIFTYLPSDQVMPDTILAVDYLGDLYSLDPADLTRSFIAKLCVGPPGSIAVTPTDTLAGNLIYSCEGELFATDLDTLTTTWRSGFLGEYLAYANSLDIRTVDGDLQVLATVDNGLLRFRAGEGLGTNTEVDLRVIASDAPDPVVSGQDIRYSASIENTSYDAANSITLLVEPPTALPVQSATLDGHACDIAETISCELPFLVNGDPALFEMMAAAGPDGDHQVVFTVSSAQADSNQTNNRTVVTTHVDTSVAAQRLLPLQSGNTWGYSSNLNSRYPDTYAIVQAGTTLVDGQATIKVSTDGQFNDYYSIDSDGIKVHRQDVVDDTGFIKSELYYDPPLAFSHAEMAPGDVRTGTGQVSLYFEELSTGDRLGPYQVAYSLTSRVKPWGSVSTGMGSFAALPLETEIRIQGEIEGTPLDETAVSTLWLTPDLGPVKLASGRITDPDYASLQLASLSIDTDSDGIDVLFDNCRTVSNPSQTDSDSDGEGDACDPDDDNDGVYDASDAFPLDAAESLDSDGDGIGNNADKDDDNDRIRDSVEKQYGFDPLNPADATADADGDGFDNITEIRLGSDPFDASSQPRAAMRAMGPVIEFLLSD